MKFALKQAIKAQRGSRGFFNLDTRWERILNATLQPLYPQRREPLSLVEEDDCVQWPVYRGSQTPTPTGIFFIFCFILQMFVPYYNRSGIDKTEIKEDINKMSWNKSSYETVNVCITACAYSQSNFYKFRINIVLRYMVSDLTCYSLSAAIYVHEYWHDVRGFVEACHCHSELSPPLRRFLPGPPAWLTVAGSLRCLASCKPKSTRLSPRSRPRFETIDLCH